MSRVVTISFTGLNAGGGVPKFNRDLHTAFPDRECVHYCWDDLYNGYPADVWGGSLNLPEWEKARVLNRWLLQTRKVTADDVIIADGFWADGLEHLPKVISHSHGIWSHLTKDDVDAGKEPDMPLHHAAQVSFRKKWTRLGKPLTAVSDFIAEQMRLQWGFESTVINNGVDTDLYRPMERVSRDIPLVIHGVNDRGNINKGWDHIEFLLEQHPDWEISSLDDALFGFGLRGDRPWQKHEVLAQADLVVHPSGYEGNSMFVAEALACGVPVVGYNVGFLGKYNVVTGLDIGMVLDRNKRSKFFTELGAAVVLAPEAKHMWHQKCAGARAVAEQELSLTKFRENWRSYVQQLEENVASK